MKPRIPQILLFVAGLLLLTCLVLPLWQITLLAPQYPHGVHMYIYDNHIGGSEPGTLQNINILNHYIGMKPIEPDSIPELKILPVLISIYSVLAFLFAFMNKRWLFLLWSLAFAISCIVGMYDFYLWEWDYGHNLAPNAPMKFEGESFQPPLFGTKQLLNFTAKSYPHWGGIAAAVALLFSILATFLKFKKSQNA